MAYTPSVNGGRINASFAGNTAGASMLVSTGTVVFAGGNNVTLSQTTGANGATVSFNAANQTVQTMGMYATGNTTQNSSTTLDARSVSMNGLGAMSVGYSGGSVQLSAPAVSSVSASGIINISTVGNTVSIGAPAFSAGMSTIGNTSGTSGTASNQIILSGGNNITLSQSTGIGGNTLGIVAPATSSLSATGAVSISTNGSTISIGAPVSPTYTTLSRWEYPEDVFTSIGALPQGSLSIQHMYVPFNVSGSAAKIGGSLSANTTTANATGSIRMSLWMGVYTLNGSTLSLASSGSTNNAFSWQGNSSASGTALSGVTGMRQLTVPMNVNMTPGEYWVAAVVSSGTTSPGASMTLYGNNQINGAATGAVLTPINGNTTAARDVVLFQGVYTAATNAGPTSIVGSQINNTASSVVQSAAFYNAIYNATY